MVLENPVLLRTHPAPFPAPFPAPLVSPLPTPEGAWKRERERRKPLADPSLGVPGSHPSAPPPELRTSYHGCQRPDPDPDPALGWWGVGTDPRAGGWTPRRGWCPGEDPAGRGEPGRRGDGGRTALPHPCRWLGVPVRRGGREGNEEEIPKPLSREKVTTEEKMPKRSGCPRAAAAPGRGRPGRGGTGEEGWGRAGRAGGSRAHPGEPRSQGDGLHGPAAWWDPALDGAGRGWTGGSGGQGWGGSAVGQRFSPPLLQTPRSPSGRWPTSAWAKPCGSCGRSSTSTRCSTPWRPSRPPGPSSPKSRVRRWGWELCPAPLLPHTGMCGARGAHGGELPGEELPHGWA